MLARRVGHGKRVVKCLSGLLGLLGEKHGVDVGEHTAGSDGDAAEELVEFFVVADGELKVAGSDAGLLVVAGGVAGKLEDFGAEVFHDSGEVHGGTTTNTGGVAAKLQVAGDTSDGELKSGLGTAASALASFLAASSFTFARHDVVCFVISSPKTHFGEKSDIGF